MSSPITVSTKTLLIAVLATFALGGCAVTAKKIPLAQAVATPAPEIKDSDGDGVPDDADECPNTRPGATVDDRGCEIIGTLDNAHFEFDSSRLTDEATAVLDSIIAVIKTVGDRRFEVGGHTDSMGSDSYNNRLGERRAISVVEYMTRMGIAASQLSVVSYGESKPVASNDSEEGRAKNRRVEIVAKPM